MTQDTINQAQMVAILIELERVRCYWFDQQDKRLEESIIRAICEVGEVEDHSPEFLFAASTLLKAYDSTK